MARFLLIDTTGETVENGARRQVDADSALAAVQAVADALPVRSYTFTVVNLDAAEYVGVTPSVSLDVTQVAPAPPGEDVPADPPVEEPPADPPVEG